MTRYFILNKAIQFDQPGVSLTKTDDPGASLLSCDGTILASLTTRDCPWFEEGIPEEKPPSPYPRLLRSIAAWRDGLWHDGPLCHWNRQGKLVNYLPTGLAGELFIPFADLNLHVDQPLLIKENPLDRCLRSVTASFKGCATNSACLTFTNFDLHSALTIVILKRVEPHLATLSHQKADFRAWPPQWRRLCENLGLRPVAPGSGGTTLPTELLAKVDLAQLEQAIRHRSAILPEKLGSC